MKRAFISGITGQDGAYLSHFLLGRGYQVYGLIRRSCGMCDSIRGATQQEMLERGEP